MKRIIPPLLLAAICIPAYGSVRLTYGEKMDRGWGEAGAVLTPYVTYGPEYLSPYCGNRVEAIRIGLAKDAANCYVYIKRRPDDPEPLYKQKVGDLTEGWNVIELDTPFEITPGQSITIGYKASFGEQAGVGVSDEVFPEACTVFFNSRNQWVSSDGSICIEAMVEGESMPVNDLGMSALSEDTSAGLPENTHRYKFYVKNRGDNDVTSYKVEISLDDNVVQTIEGGAVDVNGRSADVFELSCSDAGRHLVRAAVIEVNGVEDTNPADNVAETSFLVKSDLFVQRVVCEEYTGTWCGLCPRGIVGLELMKEEYPDTFFAVCVHGGDPMEIKDNPEVDYEKFIQTCSGAPDCNLNRRLKGDPFSEIRAYYNMVTSGECHYIIDAVGEWNEDGTAVDVKATYMSDLDSDSRSLNIAYTVTESGITGYPQTNYYADGRNGYFYGWGEKTDPTLDVVYNDVARAIVGGYDGMPCHSGAMRAMTEYECSYSVPIPGNVVSRDNVAVVVQLIEPLSGYILNACRIEPGLYGRDGVKEVAADDMFPGISAPADIRVYDLFGRQVMSDRYIPGSKPALPEGWYIVTVSPDSGPVKRYKVHIGD